MRKTDNKCVCVSERWLKTLFYLVFTEFTQFLIISLVITIISGMVKDGLNRPRGFNKETYTWWSLLHLKRSDFICIKMTSFHFVLRQWSGLEKRKETWAGKVLQMCDLSALTGAWLNNHINEWTLNARPPDILDGRWMDTMTLFSSSFPISHFAHACVSSYKQ